MSASRGTVAAGRTAAPPGAQGGAAPARAFSVERARAEFPILGTLVHGKPLVYLDNAATSQKPAAVIERLERYYRAENSNIHRGVYYLSERATAAYEEVRARARRFLNAAEEREIIFTRGTTEGINLVASSYGRTRLKAGDEIIISHMEHHSNIVPWQIIREQTGAVLRVIPMNDRGELLIDEYAKLLGPRTRLVSVVHISNAIGTVNPVKRIVEMAHAAGARVLVDGAQSAAHLPIDVRDLDCDFFVFSGHKIFGPTGTGVVYGKAELLESMPPYHGGGEMIKTVTFEKTTYKGIPHRFEAGTPHIGGVIGLGAAFDYLAGLDRAGAAEHERGLLEYATAALRQIPGLRVIGTAREKASIVSFTIEGIHPHDLGTILDQEGVAIRAGHHCTQPVMQFYGVPATARASFAFYNTRAEADALAAALRKAIELFR